MTGTTLSSGGLCKNGLKSQEYFKSKAKNEKKKQEYKEIASEHVNKFKTQDLVQTLMQWTSNENQNKVSLPATGCKERDLGNYRDYTTRTGAAHNPVRILKKKACEDLKKQMKNEYKNKHNGKDYFQCICFNKFFITRVKNDHTHNFDILNVKVKPNKGENVFSLNDVQFCTFCVRLYDKYKDNFILVNQEYIMREFIERHSKSWDRINKSYDNQVDINVSNVSMSNVCNFSFASTNTSTPYESLSNSRTESRLDSISSDKNESITQGSDFSDFYLNEILLQNIKKSTEPSRLAASHEFQRYKQKCRSVNMKINEICDLYSAKRVFSTETKSNATDDCDHGVFTRPRSTFTQQSQCAKEPRIDPPRSTFCKRIVSDTRSLKPFYLSESDENGSPLNKCRSPSVMCSQNSLLSPGKKYLFKHKVEKTKECFERMFKKIWTKCSPSAKRTRRSNLFRKAKKLKLCDGEYPSHNEMYKEQALNFNKSVVSSDFTDEYDADFSDSDPNLVSSDDCLNKTYPTLNSKSSHRNNEFLNRSAGNNVIYKERHHQTVNKFFIKQSKHLFNKNSYSDSEQVIKIQNVKKKVYTTIRRKVYDDLFMNQSGEKRNRSFEVKNRRNPRHRYCGQNTGSDDYEGMRSDVVRTSNCMNRTQIGTKLNNFNTMNFAIRQPNTTLPLRNKIQEIQYENLWKKLASEEVDENERVNENLVESEKETDFSDCVIESDNECALETSKFGKNEPKIRIKTEIQPDKDLCEKVPTSKKRFSKSDNTTMEIIDETYSSLANETTNLKNESIVRKEQSISKNYEQIKEEIRAYVSSVTQNSTAFNKQTALKLIKNLVKNSCVTLQDYAEVLKDLNVNVNLNSRNEFMIKQVRKFTDHDNLIMEQCFDRLYSKYHALETPSSSLNAVEANVETPEEVLESFDSFKSHLMNGITSEPKESTVKIDANHHKVDISELGSSRVETNDVLLDIACNDEIDVFISLADNLLQVNNVNKDSLDPVKDFLTSDEQLSRGNIEQPNLSQPSENFVEMFIIKQEMNTPNSLEEFLVKEDASLDETLKVGSLELLEESSEIAEANSLDIVENVPKLSKENFRD